MRQVNQLGRNPNLMNQLIVNNPGIAKELAQYNGDGKAMFYAKAKNMGYSENEINEFVNKLYGMIGNKL